jgi:hypothetical protein
VPHKKKLKKSRSATPAARPRAGETAVGHWEVVYFVRHRDDDPAQTAPGRDFLLGCPDGVRADLRNIVIAVAEAPPHRFAGGGMWEAMHGDMAGFYEARAMQGQMLYRLFCILEHDPANGRHLLVVIDGAAKPKRTAIPATVYARVRARGAEYRGRTPRSVG